MSDPDRSKTFEFSRYKENSVKAALDKLFHGKCAYCESFFAGTQPVDVEHYRPKGEVAELSDHPGYWWLAMEWTNLLPSCIDCNRRRNQKTPDPRNERLVDLAESGDFDRSKTISTGKASAFPLVEGSARAMRPGDQDDTEERLLIDPCREDPLDDLIFHVDRAHLVSLVCPKPLVQGVGTALPPALAETGPVAAGANAAQMSARGAVSIQVYGLNRLGLVQARTKVLRDLEFLQEMSVNLGEMAVELQDRVTQDRNAQAAASSARKAELEKDLEFHERLEVKIRGYRDQVLRQIKQMTNPKASFSAVAQAWVKSFVAS